jgi:hypothetical protein
MAGRYVTPEELQAAGDEGRALKELMILSTLRLVTSSVDANYFDPDQKPVHVDIVHFDENVPVALTMYGTFRSEDQFCASTSLGLTTALRALFDYVTRPTCIIDCQPEGKERRYFYYFGKGTGCEGFAQISFMPVFEPG